MGANRWWLTAAVVGLACSCAPAPSGGKKDSGGVFQPDGAVQFAPGDASAGGDTGTGALDTGLPTDPGSNTGGESDAGTTGGTTGGPTDTGGGSVDVPKLAECESDADCPPDAPQCAPQGVCILCYPGTFGCQGNKSMECDTFGGHWTLAEDCNLNGAICNELGGKCETGCGAGGGIEKTNVGCDFFAVDLENAFVSDLSGTLDAQNAQFAIIASNTSDAAVANVTVTHPDGTTDTKAVAPNSLEKFLLPPKYGLKGTTKVMSAYRIQSDQPITAYQFNPLSNEGVFSNDASVLLPLAGMGKEYYAVTLPQNSSPNFDFRGYVTIVGVDPGGTNVTITPAAGTIAGGGIPALSKGQSHQVNIAAGEVVNIASKAQGDDLTGTHVVAEKAVMVMSGHIAAVTGGECCADHLEQQLAPVSTWGKEYVIARSMERGTESDYFRVIAANDGTQVTVSPAVTNPTTKSLSAGQYWAFTADTHIRIVSNQPVMVVQFLASSFEGTALGKPCFSAAECGAGAECIPFSGCYKLCTTAAQCGAGHTCYLGECAPVGDPAMILAVPLEQWQASYVFLTPDSYQDDYLNVVIPTGATVQIDGTTIQPSQLEGVAGATFKVYRQKVADGSHQLTASAPVSIVVYGYDKDVSYGYPGGLGLSTIKQ